ncbi:unnamed protein product [Phaedon cochleariae]|uniref:Salivary secreted peptide n=1 Tax=Phaedon cochleariae TaxID=80249 RepID=A0A9N9WXS5_PHACE|nr:unnamed protein product [Phaedon cochleariae]
MQLWKVIVIFLAWISCGARGFPTYANEGHPSQQLRQEHVPFIEYKYVVKTIIPKEGNWWKRGTHRFYVEERLPKIIEAK